MKRRKYGDCQREDGNCAACSLSSYNRDCHGRAISKLEWYRLVNNMSVTELADASGVALRLIQRAERGNMTARNVLAIADALGVDPHDLL